MAADELPIRWLMKALCFLDNAISYIDRANLAVAAHCIPACTKFASNGFARIERDQACSGSTACRS